MVKIPLFPFHKVTQEFLKYLDGKKEQLHKDTWDIIWNLRGTPQEQVNWQDPEQWIPTRLKNEAADFALSLWHSSKKLVNPRYMRGPMFVINGYQLAKVENGHYKLTKDGLTYISADENEIVNRIDEEEGCLFILYLCSLKDAGSRKDFLGEWWDFLNKNSNYRADSVIKDSLRRRLANLHYRQLVSRDGNRYSITSTGEKYLKSFRNNSYTPNVSEEQKLHDTVNEFNKKQKQALKEHLRNMNPFKFEHLIKDLLDVMGYEDVVVTSPSNDKGVDVIGQIQNGITQVKEVIQVKRVSSNIGRPVLDQLRGSLHRFDAFQGTIITISDFAKGTKDAAFERGAAPITLINGEKLITLLIDNDIVIKKRQFDYYTIDKSYFSDNEEQND